MKGCWDLQKLAGLFQYVSAFWNAAFIRLTA